MITITTLSGACLDLERPSAEALLIPDIARGLSHCCRFAGQVHSFYSVAQHSVLVASLVTPYARRAALLHDGSEAYMGDLSRRLKHSPQLDGYRAIEAGLQDAINRKFCCSLASSDRVVKIADDLAAIFEQYVLRLRLPWQLGAIDWAIDSGFVNRSSADEMRPLARNLPSQYRALPPPAAEALWLKHFKEATDGPPR